jgi:ribosomal protein S18 acetylase RimI-like enzyme
MNILIRPLSPKLLNDYLYFFDNMVFTENPDWSKCYCYSYHFTGPDEEWTKMNNRQAVSKLISENKMRGYLAYDGDKPIGWCNANEKQNFQALKEKSDSDESIYSIVCFLISPKYRGNGIARKLLERVCLDCENSEYKYIEVYPRKGKQSCEKHYHGPLSLYEYFGFKIERENDDNYVMRKELR